MEARKKTQPSKAIGLGLGRLRGLLGKKTPQTFKIILDYGLGRIKRWGGGKPNL